MPRHRSRTAAGLLRELEHDSEYQRRIRKQATRAAESERVCAADEAALVAELEAAGCRVASVWDYVSRGGATGAAVPILVRHVELPHHAHVWEGMVRALSTRAARTKGLEPLCRLFRTEADPDRRWLLANAIGSMSRFAEVQEMPGMAEYRALFRKLRKPPHRPPAT